jgi:hypothetical protein
MTRYVPAAAILMFVLGAAGMYAQPSYAQSTRVAGGGFPAGSIEGRVLDDAQVPVAGAMVSVVGRTTAVATTGRDGRFTLRELPFGPYVLSVHSRGYWQSRGRTIQVTSKTISLAEIQLARAVASRPPTPRPASVASSQVAVRPQLAGFGLDAPSPPAVANSADSTGTAPQATDAARDEDSDDSTAIEDETAWRLRHLPRSILKDAAMGAVWTDKPAADAGAWFARAVDSGVMAPIALFSELPLSGQVNLMTSDSFNRTGQMFNDNSSRSVAYVSVNTQAAGGAWAMQGAMTQGDLASWIVAGSYRSIASSTHAYELGLSYSTQQYDGGNATALAAMRDSARNVGTVYGFDEWTLSPRLVLGYGTGFARYDYLNGAGVWSPRVSVTLPINGVRVKALASQRAVVPGAEEFAPSTTGLWLPPERTFSSLAPDGVFRPEQTRHMQVSLERDLDAGVTVAVRGFSQRINDQLVEIFGIDNMSGGAQATPLGHYFVGTAGDIDARGWGVSMIQEVPGYVRGTIEYTVTTAYWLPNTNPLFVSARPGVRSARAGASENLYDLQTSIDVRIPQTSTRVSAKYRINTAFWDGNADPLARSASNSRFNVRVNQSLPFLRFSSADWAMLLDIRNTFRDAEPEASVYDEALALRAPKRVVGGLLVRF